MMRQICDHFDYPYCEEFGVRAKQRLRGNPKNRHGAHRYGLGNSVFHRRVLIDSLGNTASNTEFARRNEITAQPCFTSGRHFSILPDPRQEPILGGVQYHGRIKRSCTDGSTLDERDDDLSLVV